MKRIFKYVLSATDTQTITLPYPNKVLSVAEQYGNIVVYAWVDDDPTMMKSYTFQIRGTGHNADGLDNYKFLGTVKLQDGELMFHVFYL